MYEVFTFKTVMRRIPLSVKLIVQHSTILIVRSERTIGLIYYNYTTIFLCQKCTIHSERKRVIQVIEISW